MRINEIAARARYMQFFYTPYRTGNLAVSIGDLQSYSANSVGYQMFNANTRAAYGAILNENETINWVRRNKTTGQESSGNYTNKHFKWVDNFVDAFALELPLIAPVRRVI